MWDTPEAGPQSKVELRSRSLGHVAPHEIERAPPARVLPATYVLLAEGNYGLEMRHQ